MPASATAKTPSASRAESPFTGSATTEYTRLSIQQRRPIEMSRDDEDRILHGLYYYRENIDEEVPVSGEQVLWLAMRSLREGESWNREGQLQSVDTSAFPDEI